MLILRFTALLVLFCLFGLGNIAQSQNPNTTKGSVVGKDKKKTDDAGAKANGKIKKVEVDGVGDSAENALKDAQRNAVSKVVGVLVDSKVMVKNDKLIEDKILTFSNGFVKSYTVIPGSQVKSGKVYKVKIEAKVEVTGIENILKREKLVATGSVDGAALLSQSEKKEKVVKNGADMLREKMKGFPENVLDVQINEKATKILKNDGETSTVQYEITVKVDLEKYKVFAKQLIQVLDKVAISKSEGSLEFKRSNKADSKQKEVVFEKSRWAYDVETLIKEIKGVEEIKLGKNSDPNNFQLIVSTTRTETGNRNSYCIYTLNKNYLNVFSNVDKRIVNVIKTDEFTNHLRVSVFDGKLKIKLLDGKGKAITSKTITPIKDGSRSTRLPSPIYLDKNACLLDSVFYDVGPDLFQSHLSVSCLIPR